jgi:cyanophycin synthetase
LLKEGARAAGLADEKITVILNEVEAVDSILRRARRGELVVIFADDLPRTWRQIEKMRDELAAAPAAEARESD